MYSFIFFVLVIMFFKFVFWRVLRFILSYPAVPFVIIFAYTYQNVRSRWFRLPLLIFTRTLAFVFGNFLVAVAHGVILAVIAFMTTERAVPAWLYFVLCGIVSVIISPPGRINPTLIFISVSTYLLVVLNSHNPIIQIVAGYMTVWSLGIYFYVMAALVLAGFIAGLIGSLRKRSKEVCTPIESNIKPSKQFKRIEGEQDQPQKIAWCPPIDQSAGFLGIWLEEGQDPPKTWNHYRGLLRRRLEAMVEEPGQKPSLVELLEEEEGFSIERLSNDELVHLLMEESNHFRSNETLQKVKEYFEANPQKQREMLANKLPEEKESWTQEELKEVMQNCCLAEWLEKISG